jgi:hypothetical protein
MTQSRLWNVVKLSGSRQAAGTDDLPKSLDVFEFVRTGHLFKPMNDRSNKKGLL